MPPRSGKGGKTTSSSIAAVKKPQHTLFPGTASQFLAAIVDPRDPKRFNISDQTLTDVTIVGKIESVDNASDPSCLPFTVKDDSGQIGVKFLPDYDPTITSDPVIQPKNIVRVFGETRSDANGIRYIFAYKVQQSSDDELKFHTSDAELHRRLQKQQQQQIQTKTPTIQIATKSTIVTKPMTTSVVVEDKEEVEKSEKAVSRVLDANRASEIGLSIEEICQAVQENNVSTKSAHDAVNRLVESGTIYPSIDNDHYKIV